MSKILAYTHKDTGEVTSVVTMSLDGGCPEDGESVGDSIVRDITDIAQDDWTSYTETKYWDNGWVTRGDKPSSNHIWQDGEWVFSIVHFSFQIRMQRLALLNQSDWTQMPDSPLSEEMKTAWADYRQELRDMTILLPDIVSEEEMEWPTSPE